MWISFLIPKIEDGNNFGVSIQVRLFMEPLDNLYTLTCQCAVGNWFRSEVIILPTVKVQV